MTAKKNGKRKAKGLIPVWVHKPGLAGYDVTGAPVAEMAVNEYGFVDKMRAGVQAAATDPMELKSYNTRQIKAKK